MTYPTNHPNYESTRAADDADTGSYYRDIDRCDRRVAEWAAEDEGDLTDYHLDRYDAATDPEDYLP